MARPARRGGPSSRGRGARPRDGAILSFSEAPPGERIPTADREAAPISLWTWVREAKSLGYILLAPSSVADTWSEVEDEGLMEILGWTAARFRMATDRVLLTGLSDGATFGLLSCRTPIRARRTCERLFEGGAKSFIFKGTNGRWRDVLTPDELATYASRVAEVLPPAAGVWLERGRHAVDPRQS